MKSGGPKPLANYTEAFTVGNLIFAAGQLASDFQTGVPGAAKIDPAFPYYGSDIKRQTRYILENLKRTFEAAGSSLDEVLKAQVFMTDLDDFNGFDEVWKEYFKVPPARTTVGTSGLLVAGTLVEIDLIGLVPNAGWKREPIKSSNPTVLANYTRRIPHRRLRFRRRARSRRTTQQASPRRRGSIRRSRITALRSSGRPDTFSAT